MPESTFELSLPDETATDLFGRRLARALPKASAQPFIIYLEGPLGAGKTCLVRGLLRELGIKGTVRSPTYTLLEIYPMGGLTCVHLDLYRLGAPDELESLGLRELLEPGHVWLVEWPEQGRGLLPAADLALEIQFEGAGRRVILKAEGALGGSVLRSVRTGGAKAS